MTAPATLRLELIDPPTARARYYELSLARSLFGDVTLTRRWGAIGRPGGREIVELYGQAGEARSALRRWQRAKERRGYCRAGWAAR